MVKVIAHRFVIFRQAFGREPLTKRAIGFSSQTANARITAPQEVLEAQIRRGCGRNRRTSVIALWDLLGIGEPIELDRPQLRAVK